MKDIKIMLQLYNTMSRNKEVFKPRQADNAVRMFSCGPSIYRRPHVGNYRSFVWEDVLQRYLEYLGYQVERVLNFTDVEDKAIQEAQEEGITLTELTDPVVKQFFEDARLLRIKLPDLIPRSSTSVDQAVRIVQELLDKGFAYWHRNNVFYDPLKFKGFGKLSRLDMSRWPKEKRRFQRDTYSGRRWNLGDFILWHGYREGDAVFWDTEIGRGRPSWNIQDPAMVTKHLGYTIDISCGGVDNLYRHHDYNIAVIEAASGDEFAHYWIHGEHLLVNGKKMSKSLGNIIYPEDLTADGKTGQHLRFYLMCRHHRKRLNFTSASFQKITNGLDILRAKFREIMQPLPDKGSPAGSDEEPEKLVAALATGFENHMNDDLDVKGAVDKLSEVLTKLASRKRSGHLNGDDCMRIEQEMRRIDTVLQVLFTPQ
jgi:cysteinyl-tRNA synthetase